MQTWVWSKCYQRQDRHKNTQTIKTFFVLLSCHSMVLLSQLIQEHGCQAWQAPHNLCWKFSPALGGWRRTTSLIPFGSNRHSREQHKYDHTWQMFLQHLTHICMSPKLHWNLTMGFVIQMDPWKCHHFLNYPFLEKVITDKAVIYKEDMSEALRKLETMNTNHSLWSKIKTHICPRAQCAYKHKPWRDRSPFSKQQQQPSCSLQPCKSTSVPAASCRRGKQESSLQLPTRHFKQQSANSKTDQSENSYWCFSFRTR